jgi:sugar transferase (PEP-CTERM system associated)
MLRIFRHYIPRTLIIVTLAEALILLGAVYLGASLQVLMPGTEVQVALEQLAGDSARLPLQAVLFATALLASMVAMGLYQRDLRDLPAIILLRIVLAFGCGLVLLQFISLFQSLPLLTGYAGLATWFVAFVGVASCRFLYLPRTETLLRRRALVIGAGSEAALIESLRRASDRRGIHIVGYLPLAGEQPRVDGSRIIERFGSLPAMVERLGLDELIVAVEERHNRQQLLPLDELLACKLGGIAVLDVAAFHERQLGKILIDSLHVGEVLFSAEYEPARSRDLDKRLFDIIVSATVLLLTLPLMALTVAAIKLESGWRGSLIYRQRRVGLDGQVFEVLKFRSMREDAEREGARWASKNDDRITRVGRFIRRCRIDELPQLINVLQGDMSFVGPRPERPEFVSQLEEKLPFYRLRHCVKPGITGWAQVCYPYGASFEDSREKLQYDLYYIKNHSLFLDLYILTETLQVVLWGKGAR